MVSRAGVAMGDDRGQIETDWELTEDDLPPGSDPNQIAFEPREPDQSLLGFVPDEKRKLATNDDPRSRSIVRILAFAPDEASPRKAGTGIVIGSNMILTAGHVVHDPRPHAFGDKNKGYAAGVLLSSPIVPLGAAGSSRRFIAAPAWRISRNRAFDLAVIRLPALLPSLAEHLAPRSLPDEMVANRKIRVYGFPELDTRPFYGRGRCVGADQGLLYHTADATEGQSGGPVLFEVDGVPTLGAVHRAGVEETPSTVPPSCGSVRLNPSTLALVDRMRAAL